MTKSLILIVTTAGIGFFVGKFFYNKYHDKKLFYSGLIEFIRKLQNNLSFKQDRLVDIVDNEIISANKVFIAQLQEFKNYLQNGGEIKIVYNYPKNETETLKKFFAELGTIDLFTQKESLKDFDLKFTDSLNTCVNEEKNKGELYVKLFTLIGVAVGVLLI